jgi:hypothetical protein
VLSSTLCVCLSCCVLSVRCHQTCSTSCDHMCSQTNDVCIGSRHGSFACQHLVQGCRPLSWPSLCGPWQQAARGNASGSSDAPPTHCFHAIAALQPVLVIVVVRSSTRFRSTSSRSGSSSTTTTTTSTNDSISTSTSTRTRSASDIIS